MAVAFNKIIAVFSTFFLVWVFIQLLYSHNHNNNRAGITNAIELEKVICDRPLKNKTEYYRSMLSPTGTTNPGSLWGFCNPFKSPVYIERIPVPSLNMTMFFLGCTFNEKTQSLSLTVFMEPDPPMLPAAIGNLHANQSDNWPLARVAVRVAYSKFICNPPVRRTSAISTFDCVPQDPHRTRDAFTGCSAKVYVWAGSETATSNGPVEIDICRKGPIKKEVALCMPYLPTAGPDWSTYIRQYIEYHKLAGISSITMFDHTSKYEKMIETYYKNDTSVVRVHWPPLSSRPDKVITALNYPKITLVRECYDQTPITTYYMVNTESAWAMALDSDEYFWDEDFVKPKKKESGKKKEKKGLPMAQNGTNSNSSHATVPKAEEGNSKGCANGTLSNGTEGIDKPSPLFERLEKLGRYTSCINLHTVVLMSNKTESRPYGDQSGIVIEDNDWVCPLSSFLKVVCRPNEIYGMEVHVGVTKRGRRNTTKLMNLHIKNVWMQRVEPNLTECVKMNKYYKPFSKDLRKALQWG